MPDASDARDLPNHEASAVDVPRELLDAVISTAGDQLVFVLGAGCSVEFPTGLKTAGEYSRELFQSFVDDGVLVDDGVIAPNDLSAVAQAVVDARGSQAPLVQRLPVDKFKRARANDGTLVLAALFREGVVKSAINLNFDLSASDGLTQLGATDVKTVDGPDSMNQFGARNLVYLHRNANADPLSWILTTDALDLAWAGKWEELVAQCLLVAPIVVFVGISTKHGVLRSTVDQLKDVLPGERYLVDKRTSPNPEFAQSISVDSLHYVPMAWVGFMTQLGDRRNTAILRDLGDRAVDRQKTGGWPWPQIDPRSTVDRLVTQTGLVEFGRARALWMTSTEPYLPYVNLDDAARTHLAELLIGLAVLERESGRVGHVMPTGFIDLLSEGRPAVRVALRSGRGQMFWSELESHVRDEYATSVEPHLLPRAVVVAHLRDHSTHPNRQVDISAEIAGPHDLVAGPRQVTLWIMDELMQNPSVTCHEVVG